MDLQAPFLLTIFDYFSTISTSKRGGVVLDSIWHLNKLYSISSKLLQHARLAQKMSRQKIHIDNTDTDNLISNLRGEVGEIVSSWVLYKDVMLTERQVRSSDLLANMTNASLNRLSILTDRLSDDIVARLSELADRKIGRLNFYFASIKMKALDKEVDEFIKYIQCNRFDEKRNSDISHKKLPEKWSDHKYLHIEPRIILRSIAKSLRLIKMFDVLHLGPSSTYLWRESRKKRYELIAPPKAGYLLLPHLRLPNDIRVKVALEEIQMGISSWDDLPTEINGKMAIMKVSKKWGVVNLGTAFFVTPEYPLIELKSITFKGPIKSKDERLSSEKTIEVTDDES